MENTFTYKEKQYTFVTPNFEFRIYSNYFIEKYHKFFEPLKALVNKRTALLQSSGIFKTIIENKEKETPVTPTADELLDVPAEILSVQMDITEQENILWEKFMLGYLEEDGKGGLKRVDGNYKKFIETCLPDFKVEELILDEDGIKFIKEVFDYFFTKTGRRQIF